SRRSRRPPFPAGELVGVHAVRVWRDLPVLDQFQALQIVLRPALPLADPEKGTNRDLLPGWREQLAEVCTRLEPERPEGVLPQVRGVGAAEREGPGDPEPLVRAVRDLNGQSVAELAVLLGGPQLAPDDHAPVPPGGNGGHARGAVEVRQLIVPAAGGVE